MSKKAKAAARLKRLSQKRAKKAANKARWREMARIGENTKSDRYVKRLKKNKITNTVSHKDGPCGNIACAMCYPKYHPEVVFT